MPLPPLNVTRTDRPAPLEGQVFQGSSFFRSAGAALQGTLGASLVNRFIVGRAPGQEDDPFFRVPRDRAVEFMKSENYDPSVLPEGDIYFGELKAIANQQSIIARYNEQANRGNLGGFGKGAASFLGFAADPLFIAAGPALGKVASFGAMPLAARIGVGAVEGGALLGTYELGIREFGTAAGDRDISNSDIARGTLLGALLGGALRGALGPRPVKAVKKKPKTEPLGEFDVPAERGDFAPLTPKDRKIAGSTAVKQFAADATIDVEAALARSVGNLKGTVSHTVLNDTMPPMKTGSAFLDDPVLKAAGAKVKERSAEPAKPVEVEQIKTETDATVLEAKEVAKRLDDPTLDAELKTIETTAANEKTLAKGIEAAVRCFLGKGVV